MDAYTAFLFGVLVGQWVLLFAIWRAVMKLVKLLNTFEDDSAEQHNNNPTAIGLFGDGKRRNRDGYDW